MKEGPVQPITIDGHDDSAAFPEERVRRSQRVSRKTLITSPLNRPPDEQVIGAKAVEFVNGAVGGIFDQAPTVKTNRSPWIIRPDC
jgi:hypothetical protein